MNVRIYHCIDRISKRNLRIYTSFNPYRKFIINIASALWCKCPPMHLFNVFLYCFLNISNVYYLSNLWFHCIRKVQESSVFFWKIKPTSAITFKKKLIPFPQSIIMHAIIFQEVTKVVSTKFERDRIIIPWLSWSTNIKFKLWTSSDVRPASENHVPSHHSETRCVAFGSSVRVTILPNRDILADISPSVS